MTEYLCRACHGCDGEVVLDLGEQPASDYFPVLDDPDPDPVHPLQMWLCAGCGLAQLLIDPTVPEEPRGTEPVALIEQAKGAVERVSAAGWIPAGCRVAEYGSPHGGSWLPFLLARGASAVSDRERADVVLDCFGLMHESEQLRAIRERTARVAPGGALLLQYHSLATIVRDGQWNALRHGHYAYYSTGALVNMLAMVGFRALSAWRFDLYGGTVLLAAMRESDAPRPLDEAVNRLLREEEELGLQEPHSVRSLQRVAKTSADALRDWLTAQRESGQTVVGYGAASRAVALLYQARIDRTLLFLVADTSIAKHGRRMPGTDIPVVHPDRMVAAGPDSVLLFVSDLLEEAQAQFPAIEAAGGRWVTLNDLA